MKLIIDIDEQEYKDICENGYVYDEDNEYIAKVIANGIPLPKGHGRLIDVNNIAYEKESIMQNDGCYTTVMIANIDATPSIIEADKGE